MATATELMGLGVPPTLANKLSDTDIYVPDADGTTSLGSATYGFSELHISNGSQRFSLGIIGTGSSAALGPSSSFHMKNGKAISYENNAGGTILTGITFTSSDTMQTGNTWEFGNNTVLYSRTDANRGAAGTAGRIIFNTDDGKLNIDNGSNWTLPDGTTT